MTTATTRRQRIGVKRQRGPRPAPPSPALAYVWMLCGCASFAVMGALAHALGPTCDWQVIAIARSVDGADSEHTIPAVNFPYRVSAEDPEVLLVDATTQNYDARWYLELAWSSQGRTGTIRIDDHGRPFQTTSTKGMPRCWYGTNDAGKRAWVPYDS